MVYPPQTALAYFEAYNQVLLRLRLTGCRAFPETAVAISLAERRIAALRPTIPADVRAAAMQTFRLADGWPLEVRYAD